MRAPGTPGRPERPIVPAHEVETREHVLHDTVVRPEAPNSEGFPVFANQEVEKPERRGHYELHLPFLSHDSAGAAR